MAFILNKLENVGSLIKRVRLSKDLTYYQLQFNDYSKLPYKSLSAIEKGKSIRLFTFFSILERLNINLYLNEVHVKSIKEIGDFIYLFRMKNNINYFKLENEDETKIIKSIQRIESGKSINMTILVDILNRLNISLELIAHE